MIEKCILDQDPRIEIEPEDFSEEADSTILVRERVRGTKLEGAFKKVEGQIVGESAHTITIPPKTGKQVVYSKGDVATGISKASSSKMANNSKVASPSKEAKRNKPQKNKRKEGENTEERPSKEQNREKPNKSKSTVEHKMGLIPQKEKETIAEDEIQIKKEENSTDGSMEKQAPENIQNTEDADPTEMRESEEEASLSIKGSIKWKNPAHLPESPKSPTDGATT